MDNQHRKISGYRELGENEIEDINELKSLEGSILNQLDSLEYNGHYDARWLSIARSDIQKGFMAAVRAVARPV